MHAVVLAALRDAGWIQGKSVPVRSWLERLENEGYRVSDYARRVLASFGGLTIMPNEEIRSAFSSGPLRVGLVVGEHERFQTWSDQVGSDLVPVGEWLDYYFVGVTTSGATYAGALGQLLYLGATFEDALETIVRAHQPLKEIKTPGT